MKIIVIIPARMESKRFPGKPLADIDGRPMIQLVYEQAKKTKYPVYIATSDVVIFDEVSSFAPVIMTSDKPVCGTDRCAEAIDKMEIMGYEAPDIVINVQCDLPYIQPDQIKQIIDSFKDDSVKIATLATEMHSQKEQINPNVVKVIIDTKGNAYNFSRGHTHSYFKHIGIYGYRTNILKEISQLEPHQLEVGLKLEQLRWLMNNYDIKVLISEYNCISIDTPDQLWE